MVTRNNPEEPQDLAAALRQSEQRFRNFIELSSEGYWEQDENYRFTLIQGGFFEKSGFNPDKHLGTTRWDHGAVPLDDDGHWDRHKAVLEARQPFTDFLFKRANSQGEVRTVSTSGQPVFDEAGRYRGYRGVARDITERRRDEQLLALEHAVTRCLAEADSTAAALRAAIRAVCQTQEWKCGRYFRVDQQAGVLRFAEAWGIADAVIERFIAASRAVTYAPGDGLAGRAWQTGKPQWVADLGGAARVAHANEAPVRGAFVFPIISEGKILGVFSFTSDKVREPDARLLQAIGVIGSQIGQFLQRKQAEEEQRRFRAAIDLSPTWIFLIDRATMRFIDVNRSACKELGYSREELLRIGPHDLNRMPREEQERAYDQLIEGRQEAGVLETSLYCSDGSMIPVAVYRGVVPTENGHLIIAIVRNISARKRAEAELRASEARFRSLTGLSSDMYWEQDEQHRLTELSGKNQAWLEDSRARLLGKRRWDLQFDNMTEAAWAAHRARLEARQPFHDLELCRLDQSGKAVWLSVSGEPVFDESGAFTGYRGVGRDITEYKQGEARIQYQASHDALTSLPNRAMFNEVLMLALQNARRYQRSFAVLFIDLDRFKIVNDTLGHEAGDKLLQEMGTRLSHAVRSGDLVARLGGDEFVVLVQEVDEAKQIEPVARKILSALMPPMVIQGQECRVTASIGICIYPADAEDERSLMQNADIAMYRAKEKGKNTYVFYSAKTGD